MKRLLICSTIFCFNSLHAQDNITRFLASDSVTVTIDMPARMYKGKQTIITFYALPNGNSTEQTMGRKMKEGDDWHFDIQHIRAQTRFIRNQFGRSINFVVIYLENSGKSWPAWKQQHPNFRLQIPALVDSLTDIIPGKKKEIHLNGHSGGGSFIFGYIAGVGVIPSEIKRITFLDSNYGYDSTYQVAFANWVKSTKDAALTVFAYNDSVALLNGKPFVSPTGGTWWRSHLMLRQLQGNFEIKKERDDSLVVYKAVDKQIRFFFKTNPDRKIFHTTQVERNGFIHSVLCGTKYDSKDYTYYGERAYADLLE
ncbi:MAG: hypothetical protein H7Y42_17685 [Chitinophagaceae bacterium]|nr:hypothetical protein [Chitinophagaceae bacterium]